MNNSTSKTIAALACLAAAPAFAHHSGAMFDTTKTLVMDGTVKEFQWTNPHSWLNVMVPNDKGGNDEYAIELVSLNVMTHNGWKPTTLKPGDKVTVTMHPMRDGSKAGTIVKVKLPDGTEKGVGAGGGALVD